MNVLQVVPRLNIGGVETGTVDMAKQLILNGHKAIVVSAGGRLVGELEKFGIRHYKLSVDKKSPFTMIRAIGALAKIIVEERADIVHARSRVPGWISYFAVRRARKAISGRTNSRFKKRPVFITTCHGYYRKHFFSRVMGWGDLVIVPSRIIGRHMMEDFKVPAERFRLIPRGVDISRFQYQDPRLAGKKEFKIGMIGRITPIKGHLDFIQALSSVARSVPNVKAVIVGELPDENNNYLKEIRLLIRRLGLEDKVEFLGGRSDIPEIMKELDLVVFSSRYPEAFGRVIIESASSGVPCVATAVGAVSDIIEDEVTGLLVSPNDATGLAEKITRLLHDPELALTLARNAYQRTKENFTLLKMYNKTLSIYNEALNRTNILVIKLSAPGDVMLATPSFRAIRRRFTDCHITCLVGRAASEIVKNCPYFDDVMIYEMRNSHSGWRKLLHFAREAKTHNFDISIDLQNSGKTHFLSFLAGIPHRYGYDNGKLSFFLNNKVKDKKKIIPPVDHQFELLKLLDIEPSGEDYLELWPRKEDDKKIEKLLKDHWIAPGQALVAFNLGSGKKWASKRWGVEKFAELSNRIARELNGRVILTGIESELPLVREFLKLSSAKPVILTNKTSLMEMASLVKEVNLVISGDSAPLHVATAMGTPFIGLFGPTDYRRHLGPIKSKYKAIQKKCICAPCYNPVCKHPSCMEKISVDEVFSAVKELI